MLKTVCDQLPESDPDLATQPTFSRLENSVTKKDLMRLSRWLLLVGCQPAPHPLETLPRRLGPIIASLGELD